MVVDVRTDKSEFTSTVPSTYAALGDGSPTPPQQVWRLLSPVAAPTGLAPMPGSSPTAQVVNMQYLPTSDLRVVEQTPAPGYVGPAWDVLGNWEPTGIAPVVGVVRPFRVTPLLAVASIAAVLAIAAAFVDVAAVDVSDQSSLLATRQLFRLNDFSTNMTVGAIVSALLLVTGALIGATGRRFGTGLAGGAGLALAGMMGMVLGQITQRFDSSEFALLSTADRFTSLTTTTDTGFGLAVVAALLGGIAFVLSLEGVGPDGHPPIHTPIRAFGLLGTAMAVIGPMLSLNGVPFGDQFTNDATPPATLLMRQLVLVLIAVGGVVGFTSNRRWGLGLALGAISVGAWQVFTAATKWGAAPLSYAGGNPGAVDFAPHTVTIVGVVTMILAGAVGLIHASARPRASSPA